MPHCEPSVLRVGQSGTDDVTQGGLLQVHDLLRWVWGVVPRAVRGAVQATRAADGGGKERLPLSGLFR